MPLVNSPLDGQVHACEQKDLPAIIRLAARLQNEWDGDTPSRFDWGLCAGEYAFAAEIYVHVVPAGRRRTGQLIVRPVLAPCITHGSDLWEPYVPYLQQTFASHGVQAFYTRGPSGPMEPELLRAGAAREVRALRATMARR